MDPLKCAAEQHKLRLNNSPKAGREKKRNDCTVFFFRRVRLKEPYGRVWLKLVLPSHSKYPRAKYPARTATTRSYRGNNESYAVTLVTVENIKNVCAYFK